MVMFSVLPWSLYSLSVTPTKQGEKNIWCGKYESKGHYSQWDLMRSVRSQTCTCFFKAEISSWQTPYEGYVLNILAKILKCSCTCHYSWLWEGYLLRRKSRYAFRCPSNPHVKLFRTSSPSLRVFILSAPTFYSTSVDFQVCNQRRNHTAAFASTWH